MSWLLCSSTRLRRAFSASKAFVWRTGSVIRFIVAVAALDFVESREREHISSSSSSSGVEKKKVIDNTQCCHRMKVRAAGGRRTGSATPSRCEQQQQQQHSGSQASIGAVVGCDSVFCGVVRDVVSFKKLFLIDQSDPHMPLKKSTFSTGCADRIARSKRHFFSAECPI